MSILLESIVTELKRCEIKFYVTVPDSLTASLLKLCEADPFFHVVKACHESDAIAVGSGLWITGGKSIVVIENSGLFNAIETVRAMPVDMNIPLLLMVTYLGRPRADTTPEESYRMWYASGGGAATHVIQQGMLTEPVVKLLGIPYCILERADGVKQIPWALNKANEIEGPVAILLDTIDVWGR